MPISRSTMSRPTHTPPAEREAVCNALLFKTNVLWVQLDALYHAYVDGHVPPGAFVPKE